VALSARGEAAAIGFCRMLWRRHDRRSRRHHLRGDSIARAAYTGLSSASLGSSTSVDWRSLFNPREPQLWPGRRPRWLITLRYRVLAKVSRSHRQASLIAAPALSTTPTQNMNP